MPPAATETSSCFGTLATSLASKTPSHRIITTSAAKLLLNYNSRDVAHCHVGQAYFGQPILFRSASGRSLASRAAAGKLRPLGTSQISTRRFLASLASWIVEPLRSFGAVV